MQQTSYIFNSKFGNISYYDNLSSSTNCIIFIHGLSCSKKVFYHQFKSLNNFYRIIALDLLGHGDSLNSIDNAKSYTISGFANSIIELLNYLNIKTINIYGWSIGANVALDVLSKFNGTKKVILDGYSPVSYIEKNFDEVFIFNEITPLISKKEITENEANLYVLNGGIIKNHYHQQDIVNSIVKDVLRAHGEMRVTWFESVMHLEGLSPKEFVTKNKDRIKLLIGEKDMGIKLDYLKKNFSDISIFYNDAGHAVFWEKPIEVNKIINNFFHEHSD